MAKRKYKDTDHGDKKMVEWALRNIPETRNSDVALMITIWKRFFPQRIVKSARRGEDAVLLRDINEIPKLTSVKRIRAQFNSEGKYYPTDWEVAKARGIEENRWRQKLGYPQKHETQNPTRRESYMDPERSRNQQSII